MSQTNGVADHGAPAPSWVAQARKFVVALIGIVAQVIASGVLDSPEYDGLRTWLQVVIGVATAAGVYAVPNATKRSAVRS